MRHLYLLLVFLLLASCKNETKIDGSSEESMEESLEKMTEEMDSKEKEEFGQALLQMAFDGTNLFEAAADTEGMQQRMRDRLNGKTAKEVVAEANSLQEKRKEKQNTQIVQEIKELEAKKIEAAESLKALDGFLIERSRFRFEKDTFSVDPIIELTVRNNTEFPISRAYFRGVLGTPGRSVPWVDDEFNYSISGGLEPGESATWGLKPNSFGEWGRAPKDRNDMVLTVTVTKLDGPDGESLLSTEFTEYDEERLRELLSETTR